MMRLAKHSQIVAHAFLTSLAPLPLYGRVNFTILRLQCAVLQHHDA
jgi:hypothetical protein